ncbi:MAG: VanZ family protein [Oscillospiraceae bacterium]|nr:VanZ family protein [Oscillospiraceae bacterium]
MKQTSNGGASVRCRVFTVLAVVWLLVIWGQSMLPAEQSEGESGSLLLFVQQVLPWMTEHLLRKAAHFTEYAILGALCFCAFRFSRRYHLPSVLLCGLSAALTDETIQLFVPGRSGQVSDVWLDFAGYLCAVLAGLLIVKCRRRPLSS